MDERNTIIGSTFLAYYPENPPGERLIKIELGYNLSFANRLYDRNKTAWHKLLTKIEGSLRQYEAQRS